MPEERAELATVAPAKSLADLRESMPDFLKENKQAPRGLEEASQQDLVMPRVAICQSGTPQRKKSDPNYIEGLLEGQLFNTLSGTNYGKTLRFIPLFFYKSRILFKPFEQGGGIICQAPDGKACQLNHGGPCVHAEWGANGESPECTELFNFPAFVLDERDRPDLAVISFKATGISAAKQLNSFIRFRNADAFAGVYQLTTIEQRDGNSNEWYVPVVSNLDWVKDPELYRYAEQTFEGLRERVKRQEVTMDTSGLSESDAAFASRDAEM